MEIIDILFEKDFTYMTICILNKFLFFKERGLNNVAAAIVNDFKNTVLLIHVI